MSWLSDWLKQVIMVVLLAAFIDLLLPNQAMQRYVKTVVSLFLLLTLLHPVFALFEKGWNAERMLAEAEALSNPSSLTASSSGTGAGKEIPALNRILAESDKLKSTNTADAKAMAEKRLAEEMKAGLEQQTGVAAADLYVQIGLDNQENPVIESVRVTLFDKSQEKLSPPARESPKSVERVMVEEVKPVTIDIRSSSSEDETEAVPALKQADDDREKEVTRYLKEAWNVDAARIKVDLAAS